MVREQGKSHHHITAGKLCCSHLVHDPVLTSHCRWTGLQDTMYVAGWSGGGSQLGYSQQLCPRSRGWHDTEFTLATWCQEAPWEKKHLTQLIWTSYSSTLWWLSLPQRARLWLTGLPHLSSLCHAWEYLLDWTRQCSVSSPCQNLQTSSACIHIYNVI